jgi:hypothetical protein
LKWEDSYFFIHSKYAVGELLFIYRHHLRGMFHLVPHLATDLVVSHL